MDVREQVDEVLNKKIDRKTFLKQAGLAIVAFVGISNLLRFMQSKDKPQGTGQVGYGGAAYGGKTKDKS